MSMALAFFRRKPKRSLKAIGKEYLEAFLFALVLVIFVIKPFIVEGYEVPTGSMEETILVGERLLAAKFFYGVRVPFTDRWLYSWQDPQRGEVVVFKYPIDGRNFIKRCIGLPGDTVVIKHKQVYVNRIPLDEPYIVHSDINELPGYNPERVDREAFQETWEERKFLNSAFVRDNFGPIIVPKGCFFMMGDNRDNSADSRFWGSVPRSHLRGRALFIYWSWDQTAPHPIWQIWHKIRWGRFLQVLWVRGA
jgi:signal peptidase I